MKGGGRFGVNILCSQVPIFWNFDRDLSAKTYDFEVLAAKGIGGTEGCTHCIYPFKLIIKNMYSYFKVSREDNFKLVTSVPDTFSQGDKS